MMTPPHSFSDSSMVMPRVAVIGGGLAGSEAALQLAERQIPVRLYDMKPNQKSPAHHSDNLAEIVCSNSMGSEALTAASGLIKAEMEQLGCQLLSIAKSVQVPAGQALAVDRELFAQRVTERIQNHPLIQFVAKPCETIPTDVDYVIVATGPMTTDALSKTLGELVNREQLYFFDAASPIIAKDSINFDVAFVQDRYALDPKRNPKPVESLESSEPAPQSYINCPLNQTQYESLVQFILDAEKTPLKSFEADNASFFESCLPVEVIASRGLETLRFGPMKPVGLVNPHAQERPHAVVQLRQDNEAGTLYNMVGFQTNLKWGPQKEMIQQIPGLENAEIVRYGVMHRNTYLHSPEVLQPTLQLKAHANILIAGQLTGTEGYTESIATGMMAAINLVEMLAGRPPQLLPEETMLGALLRYITRQEACGQNFQPINSNWGILPLLPQRIRQKRERNLKLGERGQSVLQTYLEDHQQLSLLTLKSPVSV